MRVLFLLLALSGTAFAAHPADVPLTAGTALYKAKKPAEAVTKLKEALALSQDLPKYQVQIQWFLARCYLDLQQPRLALDHLEQYVARATDPRDKAKGRRWIAKTQRRHFGAIRVVCSDGTWRITLKGATGKQRCPAQWDGLKPGKYTLTVEGSKPQVLATEITAGKIATFNLDVSATPTIKVQKAPQTGSTLPPFHGGLHLRAGVGMARGELEEHFEPSPSITVDTGLWGGWIWAVAPTIGLGVRGEISYRRWGMISSHPTVGGVFKTQGVAVPFLGVATLPYGLYALAGFGAEFVLTAQYGDLDLESSAVMPVAHAGAGWELPLSWALGRIEVRYAGDLSDPFEQVKIRRHSVTAGFSLGL